MKIELCLLNCGNLAVKFLGDDGQSVTHTMKNALAGGMTPQDAILEVAEDLEQALRCHYNGVQINEVSKMDLN